MNIPVKNGHLIHSLWGAFRDGVHSLKTFPGLLKRTIREESWREFVLESTGEVVKFQRFADFVCAKKPEGFGATIQIVKNICRDDPEALDLVDRAMQNKPGPQGESFDNVQELAPTGNSRDAALRRLRKDAPELHKQVIDGNLSAHAAMKKAGFRRTPTLFEMIVKLLSDLRDSAPKLSHNERIRMRSEMIATLRAIKPVNDVDDPEDWGEVWNIEDDAQRFHDLAHALSHRWTADEQKGCIIAALHAIIATVAP